MLIYLGTFAASVGIAAYGEHLRTKKNNEKGFYLCLALAVLVMAVLAGLRDPSIGTDSVVYEEWVADAKLQDGLLACIRQRHKTEPLFMTLSGSPCFWRCPLALLYGGPAGLRPVYDRAGAV